MMVDERTLTEKLNALAVKPHRADMPFDLRTGEPTAHRMTLTYDYVGAFTDLGPWLEARFVDLRGCGLVVMEVSTLPQGMCMGGDGRWAGRWRFKVENVVRALARQQAFDAAEKASRR